MEICSANLGSKPKAGILSGVVARIRTFKGCGERIIKRNKYEKSGTVGGGIVLLLILVLVVLAIVRLLWLNAANDYYDTLTSVYISQNNDYQDSDREKLQSQLLEDGIFFKIHRWDKEDFIKDKELYKEMTDTYKRLQRRNEKDGSVMQDLINL